MCPKEWRAPYNYNYAPDIITPGNIYFCCWWAVLLFHVPTYVPWVDMITVERCKCAVRVSVPTAFPFLTGAVKQIKGVYSYNFSCIIINIIFLCSLPIFIMFDSELRYLFLFSFYEQKKSGTINMVPCDHGMERQVCGINTRLGITPVVFTSSSTYIIITIMILTLTMQ